MSDLKSNSEVEIKLKVADAASALALILGAGFQVSVPRVFEVNTIYDTPDLQLRRQGILLRLRSAGEKFTLTAKGKSVAAKHKVRQEDEVTVSEAVSCHRILLQLQYEPMFRYQKYRTEFSSEQSIGTITLDETPIGTFLELEGGPDWIDATAKRLNVAESDYLVDSYGKLYMTYRQDHPESPVDMVFEI